MNESCEKCRYAFQGGVREGKPAFVCRRYPPTVQHIVVMREATKSVVLKGGPQFAPTEEQRSTFPQVMDNWACGEFAPSLALTS